MRDFNNSIPIISSYLSTTEMSGVKDVLKVSFKNIKHNETNVIFYTKDIYILISFATNSSKDELDN